VIVFCQKEKKNLKWGKGRSGTVRRSPIFERGKEGGGVGNIKTLEKEGGEPEKEDARALCVSMAKGKEERERVSFFVDLEKKGDRGKKEGRACFLIILPWGGRGENSGRRWAGKPKENKNQGKERSPGSLKNFLPYLSKEKRKKDACIA